MLTVTLFSVLSFPFSRKWTQVEEGFSFDLVLELCILDGFLFLSARMDKSNDVFPAILSSNFTFWTAFLLG
jgi:hypothetical protein